MGMGRGLITDPDFVNKAKAGKFDEIRQCVACNQRCFDHVFMLKPVGCAVNPRAGKEAETEFGPTDNPKKILVAGAGPAGCEFAITAAQRGHKVIVCEKSAHIGGQVNWFAEATHKTDFRHLLTYYRAMLVQTGVEVRTGVAVTPELVAKEKPDLVVVATGAAPFKPPIEAVDAPQVVTSMGCVAGQGAYRERLWWWLGAVRWALRPRSISRAKAPFRRTSSIFLSLHQAESQEFLRNLMVKGIKNITVIEMAPKIGQDIGPSTRWVVLKGIGIERRAARDQGNHERYLPWTGGVHRRRRKGHYLARGFSGTRHGVQTEQRAGSRTRGVGL